MVGRSDWNTMSDYFTQTKLEVYIPSSNLFFFLAGKRSNAKQEASSAPAAAGLGLAHKPCALFILCCLTFSSQGETK